MSSDTSPEIHIPEQWSEAANSIASSSTLPITLICGPKNCGKTTFSRYLVNLLLTTYKRVAYLDIDVGQPEFTPPGLISLTMVREITPDLTIPYKKIPKRSLFFGDVSPKTDPSTYLKYVFSIYDYYQKEYRTFHKGESSSRIQVPLVVNTCGWVKGVGYDVLVDTLKYICPTHIVNICISNEIKDLPAGKFWLGGEDDGTSELIEINSACRDSSNRSVLVRKNAALLRDFRIRDYFRQCFPSDISTIKELAQSLTSLRPYQVPIASIKIRHVHREVPRSEIFYCLNASIVGFAVESKEPENLPWCLGLGIVRGIDTVKGMLYVITPVPYGSLKKVNLLLQGYIQIPTNLMQVKGCMSPYISENVLNTKQQSRETDMMQ